MEAALAFAAEVGTAASESDRADMWFLERIARLLHSEIAAYYRMDSAERLWDDTEYPDRPWTPFEDEPSPPVVANPFCHYAVRTSQPYHLAQRLSDVVRSDALNGIDLNGLADVYPRHCVQTRMPGRDGSHWTLEVARTNRNYSDRELLLLNTLRPYLIGYESQRTATMKLAALVTVRSDSVPEGLLSPREGEVLDLVAGGASNAEIAQRLWVSPATVKKHLENVYAKLTVRSRTAALARTGRTSTSASGTTAR
jgi:DNA-binding CsgD family transcriptional regulator